MGTVPFCHVIKLSIIDYLGMCKRGLSPFASRLIALVLFKVKMVYIRFIGTHDEYDKLDDIKNI